MSKGTTSSAKIQVSKPDIQSFNRSPKNLLDEVSGFAVLCRNSIHEYTKEYPEPTPFVEIDSIEWGTHGVFSLIPGMHYQKEGNIPENIHGKWILDKLHTIGSMIVKIIIFDRIGYSSQEKYETLTTL